MIYSFLEVTRQQQNCCLVDSHSVTYKACTVIVENTGVLKKAVRIFCVSYTEGLRNILVARRVKLSRSDSSARVFASSSMMVRAVANACSASLLRPWP